MIIRQESIFTSELKGVLMIRNALVFLFSCKEILKGEQAQEICLFFFFLNIFPDINFFSTGFFYALEWLCFMFWLPFP
jgi:hypothetical protein